MLRQWASQTSVSITDDDTPSEFFWTDNDDNPITDTEPSSPLSQNKQKQQLVSAANRRDKPLSEIEQERLSSIPHSMTRRDSPLSEIKQQHEKQVLNATELAAVMNLIPKSELDYLDQFSDSWLVDKTTFLDLNINRMPYVEQACFLVMTRPFARMFVDWTDFMVEHMSKWWGELRVLQDMDSAMYEKTRSIFRNLVLQQGSEKQGKSPLHRTIGMVAFQQYRSIFKDRQNGMSCYPLAATLGSLLKVGFGRILVVGYGENDKQHVEAAFALLKSATQEDTSVIKSTNTTMSLTIGRTELAFIRVPNLSWVNTSAYNVNMPKATLQGMQLAIRGTMNFLEHNTTTEEWLGTTHNASYWKYFYLTEPDTILHTKREVLPWIRKGLDQGLAFLPHRLQPLPHEYNLPDAKDDTDEQKYVSDRNSGRFLPGDVYPFSNITFLNPWNGDDHCCDGGPGWPGRTEEFGEKQFPCGNWWWACSFSDKHQIRNLTKSQVLEVNRRIVPYPMMSLTSGTGVIFGPSEQGRRCIPSKTSCPKTQKKHKS